MGVLQHAEVWHALFYPSKHSATERKRAYFYLFASCLGLAAFLGSMLNFIVSWMACGLLQVTQVILTMLLALNVADLRDKCLNVLECERTVNNLLECYVLIRIIQFAHALLILKDITMAVSFFVSLMLILWRITSASFFADATNLWRVVGRFERDTYIFVFKDVVIFVVFIIAVIFAMISKYAD
ncbi:putative Cornichon protein [Trypanosoma vivax]|uniref:Uncharacterized protein n=1 Tax=Trypanosoma vivax (strain Y486) TaxID=1055687 RepID=G0U9F6_TRYVY|nr:hypothetical protein TRVL_05680 [Trypanosoma vivax]KAH8605072.1 putative Cornichon protein [Trypanosoma vivax]CCC54242.1 putative Hypothetical protein [Trypanosoma vivax Y486]